MDWDLAIERNRLPLLRIVASLFAMIGLSEGGTVARLSWPLYRAVLRVLRPAEAAVRRLIVIAARDMVVTPAPSRSAPSGGKRSSPGKDQSKGKGKRRVAFQLVDPRERVMPPRQNNKAAVRAEPGIRVIDCDPLSPLYARHEAIAPAPKRVRQATANAGSLCRRLAAIKAALEDLTSQAKRYARWRAKPIEQRRPKLASALRPGDPPGYREKCSHAVDAILSNCEWLALALPEPDTS